MKRFFAGFLAAFLLLAAGCAAPAAEAAPASAEPLPEGLSSRPFTLEDTTYAFWRIVRNGIHENASYKIQVLQKGQKIPVQFTLGGNGNPSPKSLLDMRLSMPDGSEKTSTDITFAATAEVAGYDLVASFHFFVETLPETAVLFRSDKDVARTLDLRNAIVVDGSGIAETAAPPEPTAVPEPTPMPDMEVTSDGIVDGEMGLAYGRKGEQFVNGRIPTRSLPLTISYIPEGTKALALTMIDPDGGNWVHWLAANIPVDQTSCELPENASIDLAGQMVQGRNDFEQEGYGGPTPPAGVHTYVITVYALGETVELTPGYRLKALRAAMDGKVLAKAVIKGSYAR